MSFNYSKIPLDKRVFIKNNMSQHDEDYDRMDELDSPTTPTDQVIKQFDFMKKGKCPPTPTKTPTARRPPPAEHHHHHQMMPRTPFNQMMQQDIRINTPKISNNDDLLLMKNDSFEEHMYPSEYSNMEISGVTRSPGSLQVDMGHSMNYSSMDHSGMMRTPDMRYQKYRDDSFDSPPASAIKKMPDSASPHMMQYDSSGYSDEESPNTSTVLFPENDDEAMTFQRPRKRFNQTQPMPTVNPFSPDRQRKQIKLQRHHGDSFDEDDARPLQHRRHNHSMLDRFGNNNHIPMGSNDVETIPQEPLPYAEGFQYQPNHTYHYSQRPHSHQNSMKNTTQYRAKMRSRHRRCASSDYTMHMPTTSRYLNEYTEVREIGKGSFGRVVQCTHNIDGMDYAIKQITKDIKGEKHRQYILREVQALAAQEYNPHIVRYYGAWIEQNTLFVQMELCREGSLDKKQEKGYQWSELELLELIRQVANGLYLMHKRQLVHLDIKPENIYEKAKNYYKIGDLGLVASSLEENHDLEEGDCRYLAREALGNKPLRGMESLSKIDIFALGASVYELALGESLPQNSDNWHRIRVDHSFRKRIPRRFSDAFWNLINNMMHADPAARPNAQEIIEDKLITRFCIPPQDELMHKVLVLQQLLAEKDQFLEDALKEKPSKMNSE